MVSILTSSKSTLFTTHRVQLLSMIKNCIVNFVVVSRFIINFEVESNWN